MAYITDDIIAYLSTHASITPLITTSPLHIFSGAIPKKVGNVLVGDTFISLEENGGDKARTMAGPTGDREPLYVIRVTAPTKSKIKAIFFALDEALEVNTTQVTMGDMVVQHGFLSEPEDTSTATSDGTGGLTLEMAANYELLCRVS